LVLLLVSLFTFDNHIGFCLPFNFQNFYLLKMDHSAICSIWYATFKISKDGQFYNDIGHFTSFLYRENGFFTLNSWFSMKNGHFCPKNSFFPCSRSKYWIIFELRYVIIICLPSFKPSKPLPKSPICPHLVSFIKTIWKWGPPRSPTSLAPLHIPDSGRSDGGLRGALRRELEAKTKLLRTHVK